MFRALIGDAKSATGAVIGKYAIRASVGVPFVVALGFGTAALTLILVERFGSITAYAIMAGGFAVIGLIALAIVAVKERKDVAAPTTAEKQDTAGIVASAAAQAAGQIPLALLSTLVMKALVPRAANGGMKMLARNLPVVLLFGLAALLLWPTGDKDEAAAADESKDPDGAESEAEQRRPQEETHQRAA